MIKYSTEKLIEVIVSKFQSNDVIVLKKNGKLKREHGLPDEEVEILKQRREMCEDKSYIYDAIVPEILADFDKLEKTDEIRQLEKFKGSKALLSLLK